MGWECGYGSTGNLPQNERIHWAMPPPTASSNLIRQRLCLLLNNPGRRFWLFTIGHVKNNTIFVQHQQFNVKYFNLSSVCAGIQTHNLSIMNLLPYPQDQNTIQCRNFSINLL